MKILVTGHKGFLGNEFVKKYANDYEIVGFDHKDGEELLDYNQLLKKMKGCEHVVHLAAIPKPVVGKTFDDYVANNVQATSHVLKAAIFHLFIKMPPEILEDITQSLRSAHKDKSYFHHSLRDNYQSQYQKYEDRIEKMYENKLDGAITQEFYDKKKKEFRGKQKELLKKMKDLQVADEEYYITSDYILNLASRAPELFESSEPIKKRQLLKFVLQNLQIDGSLVCYDELKPFDSIRLYAARQAWLAKLPSGGTRFTPVSSICLKN